MSRNPAHRRTTRLAFVVSFAAALVFSPLALTEDFQIAASEAEAKGGKGGGNGGGNGGGKGQDKSAKGNGDSGRPGKSGTAPGHNKNDPTKAKNTLGSLNAANASDQARANASPNSRVGKLAEYERALKDGDLDAAAQALAGAANKDITPEVVKTVNETMEIETDFTPEEIAEAAAKQAPETEESHETAATAENGGDDPQAGDDAIASAAKELLDGSSQTNN